APVMPHLTEEIYSHLYSEGDKESIHVTEWPTQEPKNIDNEAERIGDLVIDVITELRKEKNRKGLSLNKPMKKLTIFTDERTSEDVQKCEKDIKETLKINEIEYTEGTGERTVEGRSNISFTLIE
ncbi:class I tRNA ligase family protein, partial [Candidatus Bathyarchaeota archaeon]|nr:class I tRNA ligase family protein [Candidatus Bathyarchaeota archaeon]